MTSFCNDGRLSQEVCGWQVIGVGGNHSYAKGEWARHIVTGVRPQGTGTASSAETLVGPSIRSGPTPQWQRRESSADRIPTQATATSSSPTSGIRTLPSLANSRQLRSEMSRVVWQRVGLAAVALAAIAALLYLVDRSSEYSVVVESYELTGDVRELVLHATGGIGDVVLPPSVREDANQVVVAMRHKPTVSNKVVLGVPLRATVLLSAPLGSRKVVDASGADVPLHAERVGTERSASGCSSDETIGDIRTLVGGLPASRSDQTT